ncbi:hypothetical protein C8F04DRAFT_1234412 [Mycena alexandri]|uniref:Uncharacterized protein n=1 Tax=Mycena alexandri TaxID=1745969 RepID=A0AAD6X6N8_9AGAR|nr:hypothetical protein C8F04DRAFT_1234412 [Mycena alexandri]
MREAYVANQQQMAQQAAAASAQTQAASPGYAQTGFPPNVQAPQYVPKRGHDYSVDDFFTVGSPAYDPRMAERLDRLNHMSYSQTHLRTPEELAAVNDFLITLGRPRPQNSGFSSESYFGLSQFDLAWQGTPGSEPPTLPHDHADHSYSQHHYSSTPSGPSISGPFTAGPSSTATTSARDPIEELHKETARLKALVMLSVYHRPSGSTSFYCDPLLLYPISFHVSEEEPNPNFHKPWVGPKNPPGNARGKTPGPAGPSTAKTARTTRATPDAAAHLHAGKTRTQLYDGSDLNWAAFTLDDARNHLVAKGFLLKTEGTAAAPSPSTLSLALLRVAAFSTNVVVSDACRAVAFILERRKVESQLEALCADVKRLVEREEGGNTGGAEDARAAAVSLTNTVHEQRAEIERMTERLEESMVSLVGRLEAMEGAGAEKTTGAARTSAGPTSFAAVVAAPPPIHAAAVASVTARTRQILIEKAPGTEEWMTGLSPKDVVEKARMALELMRRGGAQIPTDTKFLGAVTQRRGAMVLHMSTTEAADWLKANMGAFLASLGVAQFVPLSFDPSQDGALHVVEGDNNLPSGALAKMHWIKPAERRSPGQKVATRYWDSRTSSPQIFSCGTACAKVLIMLPRTARAFMTLALGAVGTCKAGDEERACANCRNAKREHRGHGAADRSCPVFTDKLQFSLERNPDAKYPYFPAVDDPTSWVTHEELSQRQGAKATEQPEWQRIMNTRRRQAGPPAGIAAAHRAAMGPREWFDGGARVVLERGKGGFRAGNSGQGTRMRQTFLDEIMGGAAAGGREKELGSTNPARAARMEQEVSGGRESVTGEEEAVTQQLVPGEDERAGGERGGGVGNEDDADEEITGEVARREKRQQEGRDRIEAARVRKPLVLADLSAQDPDLYTGSAATPEGGRP